MMSTLAEHLSTIEIEVVRRALQATVEGDFFPDWEFETLIGVPRETVRQVYADWPDRKIADSEFSCAVVGSLNNVLS